MSPAMNGRRRMTLADRDNLAAFNTANARARADYRAHPTTACHAVTEHGGCDQLRRNDPRYCDWHLQVARAEGAA
ncbi:MAG: hypothetical protein LH630_08940 [Actinomycetia bacterium]|nr:hypothetical protein [Actinomycetes bacterium]